MDIPFFQVWCSDLKRAYETAAIVFGDRGLAIMSAPELHEIDLGQWDGMAMLQIRKQFPDLQQRAVPFIRHIAADYLSISRCFIDYCLIASSKDVLEFGRHAVGNYRFHLS